MNSTIAIPSDQEIPKSSQERVFDIILNEDDLNWKDMIYDLVRKENMNPWDIDVSLLAQKFLEMLNQLKEMDFRISGKAVLTSSLLLKIKSDKLLIDDIQNLDNLIAGPAEEEFMDEDGFEYEQFNLNQFLNDQKKIVPRSPQPRERKVSVFDLVDALEQALETDSKRQRVLSRVQTEESVKIPTKVFDLGETMDAMHKTLAKMLTKSKTKVFFKDLLPGETKEDKVYTFLPLLHLENQRKVDLLQEEHFGEINVVIHNKKFV